MANIFLKQNKFIDNYEGFLSIKMVLSCDGMNTEIKKLLSILIEKIEEDTTMLSGNHEGGNQYLSDISLVKICGMEMDCV